MGRLTDGMESWRWCAGCGSRKSVTYLLCELELSSFGWLTVLMNLNVNPVILGKVQDLADFPLKKIIHRWLLHKITQMILAFPFRDMKWKDRIWKCLSWNLPQNTAWGGLSEQFLECVLLCGTSWFVWLFTPFSLRQILFLKKKVAHFAIIIPLWTIAVGSAALLCAFGTYVRNGTRYPELGYTFSNRNNVSMTVCWIWLFF